MMGEPQVIPLPPPPPQIVKQNPASLSLEYRRAILVLKRGQKLGWSNRDQFITAFNQTPITGAQKDVMQSVKDYVSAALKRHLRVHDVWDEGPPIGVEVQRAIDDFTKQRNQLLEAENSAKR
ncbi:MAG: hypothetical protein ABR990_01510 [Terracidiphilus sp.]|jgi:uncharacterized protein YfeS